MPKVSINIIFSISTKSITPLKFSLSPIGIYKERASTFNFFSKSSTTKSKFAPDLNKLK